MSVIRLGLAELGADFFEECFGGADAGVFVELSAFVFDADVTGVTGCEDNLHHAAVVGFGFVTVFVEVMGLGADGFGEGHEFFDAFVAVVPLFATDAEVAEVGEGAAVGEVDSFHDTSEPCAVAGESTVIFHDDIEFVGGGEFGELAEAISGALELFFVGACAAGVDADGVAAECFGGFDPFEVIFNSLTAFGFVGVTEVSFAVDHDQQLFDAGVGSAFVEFGEVGGVFGFVLEELVDVFDGVDAEFLFGGGGEVEVIKFSAEDGAVERPFGKGDFGFGSGCGCGGESAREGSDSGGSGGRAKKRAAGGERIHVRSLSSAELI